MKNLKSPKPDSLGTRIRSALREGRTKQALELAKQLFKQEPSCEHRKILRETYIERARQLRSQGADRDAVTVLENALELSDADTEPDWWGVLAKELLASGGTRLALSLMDRVPESSRRTLLEQLADEAIRGGPSQRGLLPADLQAPFDAVQQAFARLENGEDEAVRSALRGIGLHSPFLEWKVLARGMMAYYQKDDARAVENWRRLDPQRLPFRVAAPMRFEVDREFRHVQPAAGRPNLQRSADRMQDSLLFRGLRVLQAELSNPDELSSALRRAANLLSELHRVAPELEPRLAACFFWAIVQGGGPQHVERYGRVFGAPAEDPGLNRLKAMSAEAENAFDIAHGFWQQFEMAVADRPELWHGQAEQVRALIWARMGENAASLPEKNDERLQLLPAMLRDLPGLPKELEPGAEACYRRALALAPDRLATHQSLAHYYLERDQVDQAEKTLRGMIERFPDCGEAHHLLANVLVHREAFEEAVAGYREAVRANPLERLLQEKLAHTRQLQARAWAEAGELERAVAEYEDVAATLVKPDFRLHCRVACCLYKAKQNERAEQALAQARQAARSQVGFDFQMTIEAIRFKLPAALKKRFESDFLAGLEQAPTAEALLEVAYTASVHSVAQTNYRGQKGHEKKVLAYLGKADQCPLSAAEAGELGSILYQFKQPKWLRRFVEKFRRKHRNDAQLCFLEAESYLMEGPERCSPYRVLPLLNEASELAAKLTDAEKRHKLLDAIEERRHLMGGQDHLFQMMQSILMPGFDDDDDGW